MQRPRCSMKPPKIRRSIVPMGLSTPISIRAIMGSPQRQGAVEPGGSDRLAVVFSDGLINCCPGAGLKGKNVLAGLAGSGPHVGLLTLQPEGMNSRPRPNVPHNPARLLPPPPPYDPHP